MNFIKNNWLLLLILILVIYFGWKYYNKTKIEEKTILDLGNSLQISNVIKSNGNVETVLPVNNNEVLNNNSSSWKIGDKIYAGATGVNSYSAPTSGTNFLVKYYSKDSYIGTYLGNEKGYAKVIVQENINDFLKAFGYENNTIRFLLINQVYSK